MNISVRFLCVVLSVSILLLDVSYIEAGPIRNRIQARRGVTYRQAPVQEEQYQPISVGVPTVTLTVGAVVVEESPASALSLVNSQRAARGLRPYIYDEALTQAAQRTAAFRAQNLMFGHTQNDFGFLNGGSAAAAGCAAYPASYGFMACCVYDNYTYAGAASVMGRDGKMYHHIFVR